MASASAVLPFVFRQYTNDKSFSKGLIITPLLSEYQISLVFARENYDDRGYSDGQFEPGWDARPSEIRQFKSKLKEFGVNVKVFISIGGRDRSYPFNPKDANQWINNATSSLKSIIAYWEADGIDIYYEHIQTNAEVFSDAVGRVIQNLKGSNVITVASISPSDAVTPEYRRLFSDHTSIIDSVYYQFQNELKPVPSADSLLIAYHDKVAFFSPDKFVAGYSFEDKDWGTVSPSEFRLALITLLNKDSRGFSVIYY